MRKRINPKKSKYPEDYHILRGGSWFDNVGFCRSTTSGAFRPDGHPADAGLRLFLYRKEGRKGHNLERK